MSLPASEMNRRQARLRFIQVRVVEAPEGKHWPQEGGQGSCIEVLSSASQLGGAECGQSLSPCGDGAATLSPGKSRVRVRCPLSECQDCSRMARVQVRGGLDEPEGLEEHCALIIAQMGGPQDASDDCEEVEPKDLG